jgi:hypothetical protein
MHVQSAGSAKKWCHDDNGPHKARRSLAGCNHGHFEQKNKESDRCQTNASTNCGSQAP